MKKSEENAIIKWVESLTDEELEKEYYDSVFNSLGSQTEQMYELGYDMADIQERDSLERYVAEKTDLLAALCEGRGIELWRE